MKVADFTSAYQEPRNGVNQFYRHWFTRKLIYSDGVQACAEAGTHWLLDIIATEIVQEMRKHLDESYLCVITVKVSGSKASIRANITDEHRIFTKLIEWTDMPDGNWKFYLAHDPSDGGLYSLILPSEY